MSDYDKEMHAAATEVVLFAMKHMPAAAYKTTPDGDRVFEGVELIVLLGRALAIVLGGLPPEVRKAATEAALEAVRDDADDVARIKGPMPVWKPKRKTDA